MVFLKCTLKSKKLSHSLFEFFRFFSDRRQTFLNFRS